MTGVNIYCQLVSEQRAQFQLAVPISGCFWRAATQLVDQTEAELLLFCSPLARSR